MNLGSLNDNIRDEKICRVVLHEFYHALGCVHVHQSLAAYIQWNEEKVIADARRLYGWSEHATRTDILREEVYATKHSAFDPNSIMCYMTPPEWTLDRHSINENLGLSDTDISFIRKMYPFRTRDAGYLRANQDIRPPYPPLALNSKIIEFDSSYPMPPRIMLGLALIDEAKTGNIRVRVHTPPQSQRTGKNLTLNLDTWADKKVYNAAATWLEFAKGEVEFEVGQFDTNNNRSFEDLPPVVDGSFRRDGQHVDFPHGKCAEAPNVMIWSNALDLSKDFKWRTSAATRNVTTSGFDVLIESWDNTIVHSASAT
ncbi:hypothetical protein C7999DRAFT_32167 [Corynascus novoguineensis]|uniref:H-type lectin domain-containing protein n=1 Tax=Corynascus novoguineensis TaxID=1126955 RepID=A0AAN7CT19_9PEZI|nr:hypothetical protein C7999DRAFT_32167 [Corynascus novoguineensis]